MDAPGAVSQQDTYAVDVSRRNRRNKSRTRTARQKKNDPSRGEPSPPASSRGQSDAEATPGDGPYQPLLDPRGKADAALQPSAEPVGSAPSPPTPDRPTPALVPLPPRPRSFARIRGWLGYPVYREEDIQAGEWRVYERCLGLRRVYLNDLRALVDLLRSQSSDPVQVWNAFLTNKDNPPPNYADNLTQVRRWAILYAGTDDWILNITLRFSQSRVRVNSRSTSGFRCVDQIASFFNNLPDKSGDALSRLFEPIAKFLLGVAFISGWFASGQHIVWSIHYFTTSRALGPALILWAGWWAIRSPLQALVRLRMGSAIIVPYARPVHASELAGTAGEPEPSERKEPRERSVVLGVARAVFGWVMAVLAGVAGIIVYNHFWPPPT